MLVCMARSRRRQVSASLLSLCDPIARAVVALLDPYCEVVLHDLGTGRIAGIWGEGSGRDVGDESLVDEIDGADEVDSVHPPYGRVALDGRVLTSVSAVLRDDAGVATALLCINVDRSEIDRASKVLQGFLAGGAERPPALFANDWREGIALAVDDFCRRKNVTRHGMDRADRTEIVAELEAKGLFATRHAATHVATALGVSRASIYNALKEVRQ
jgi:predicted transcriptional regulator YheO